jgi:hypothetical protein
MRRYGTPLFQGSKQLQQEPVPFIIYSLFQCPYHLWHFFQCSYLFHLVSLVQTIDQCTSWYIYVSNLPEQFNAEILGDCQNLSHWFDMHISVSNHQFWSWSWTQQHWWGASRNWMAQTEAWVGGQGR